MMDGQTTFVNVVAFTTENNELIKNCFYDEILK